MQKNKGILSFLLLTLLLFTVLTATQLPVTASASENLLVNPDAESGDSDVGWQNGSGPLIKAANGGRTGKYFQIWAQGYTTTNSSYYQDVDVSSLEAKIDAGLIMIHLNGYYFTEGTLATDYTKIILEMLDADGNVLAGPFICSCSTIGSWESFEINKNAVPGTRKLRVTMDAYISGDVRFNPVFETIYHYTGFDDMSLTISEDLSTAPVISPIANQVADSGRTLGPLTFTVSDVDTDLSDLTVSAYSTNQKLIPDANITVSLNGANGTVSLKSADYEIGEADVVITVSDENKTSYMRFHVIVYPDIQLGSNIVINGNGESLIGWTNPEGRIYNMNDQFIVGTVASTDYFMYQDIDITRFSSIIDKGLSRFTASCDTSMGGQMTISGLNADGSKLWTKESGSLIDAGTRKIRVSIGGPQGATIENISVIIQNSPPILKSGIPTTASASVLFGDTYTLDLSTIFTDIEDEPIRYKVSFNKAPAVYINDASPYASLYSYTPTEPGETTHKFLAEDSALQRSDDDNRYLLTLTAVKRTPTAADLTYSLDTKTYNGLVQPIIVTGPSGLGTITVKYNGTTGVPKDAGVYEVTVSITEGTIYSATVDDISLGSYTIEKVPLTITGGTVATKVYDGMPAAAINAISFSGLINSDTLDIGTDYTVTDAAFDSANAGDDKFVTGTVVLTNSETARNYILNDSNLYLTGQRISKATAPSGIHQTLEVFKNYSQDYSFDLSSLLPTISDPKSLGTVTYTPSITDNGDGILSSLNYTSGNTLIIPVNQISDASKSAAIQVTVKSTNYADFDAVITVQIIEDVTVSLADITGITAPVRGEVPVTAITQSEQYSGTVTWDPEHNPFESSTVYTAYITLIPKVGYTLNGIPENFFTVAGAIATNAANSGEITAVFPATAEPITTGTITGMVKDSSGNPINDAEVSLIISGSTYSATTDTNGSYRIFNVPSGTGYTVTASKEGYTSASVPDVEVVAEEISSGVDITLASLDPDEDGCLVTYKGAQLRYNEDTNSYDIRFIATIDTLNAKEVGYVFSKTQKKPTKENASVKATTTVYTEITASGAPITAESLGGQYIIACSITGIPAEDIDVTLYVRAFSTVGTVTKYTPVRTVTVADLMK